jgi:hypothetical protein
MTNSTGHGGNRPGEAFRRTVASRGEQRDYPTGLGPPIGVITALGQAYSPRSSGAIASYLIVLYGLSRR